MNFLIFVVGSLGNATPFVQIASKLFESGHTVYAYTNLIHTKLFEDAGARATAVDTEEDYIKYTASAADLNRPDRLSRTFLYHYIPQAHKELLDVFATDFDGPCIIVSNDTPGITGRLLAERLGWPLASVVTYPNHIEAISILRWAFNREVSRALALLRVALGLPTTEMFPSWVSIADLYIALWPRWFREVSHSDIRRLCYAGFALPSIGNESDREAGVTTSVLITGGSATFAGPEFMPAAIQGCEESELTYSVLTRRLNVPLGPKGTHLEFVPDLQAAIRKTGVVLHHGGMGTIAQCLKERKPQLILAKGGDRPANGRIVAGLGLGRYLIAGRWLPREIASALIELESRPPRALPQDIEPESTIMVATTALRTLEALCADKQAADFGDLLVRVSQAPVSMNDAADPKRIS